MNKFPNKIFFQIEWLFLNKIKKCLNAFSTSHKWRVDIKEGAHGGTQTTLHTHTMNVQTENIPF